MLFEPTGIPDVVLVKPYLSGNSQDLNFVTWEHTTCANAGIGPHFVQDNQSGSIKHTLRGLGYQIQKPQGKLVRVVRGAIFDVAVDLRRSSGTFGAWQGTLLSEDNHHLLWVPPGFAHGFLTLSDFTIVLYRCTDYWSPCHERTIIWNDSELDIKWPLTPGNTPLVSEKDALGRSFRDSEHFD